MEHDDLPPGTFIIAKGAGFVKGQFFWLTQSIFVVTKGKKEKKVTNLQGINNNFCHTRRAKSSRIQYIQFSIPFK